jgi:quinoprotein relay system zinc metallohydrolase 2
MTTVICFFDRTLPHWLQRCLPGLALAIIPSAGWCNDAFNLEEVAAGIYVHQGMHLPLEDPRHDDIANIGFIVGERCVAVVDTGGSVRIGQALRRAIRDVTPLPVCYVINSHIHFDHLLGNSAFRQDNPAFVGHYKLRQAIAANRNFFLDAFGADLGENPSDDDIIGPDTLVEDTLELDLGNRELLLVARPTAHSHADLTVFDRKTNTLWLADLLFMKRIPVLDGSLRGWLQFLAAMRREEFSGVIPGHGPAIANWPEAVMAQQRYLHALLDETRSAIVNDVFMEDALETVGQTQHGLWLLFDQNHKRNVTRAYKELEWE